MTERPWRTAFSGERVDGSLARRPKPGEFSELTMSSGPFCKIFRGPMPTN
jgi:hypothetical protein